MKATTPLRLSVVPRERESRGWRQETSQDAPTVERRDRNQIEERQKDVDHHRVEGHDADGQQDYRGQARWVGIGVAGTFGQQGWIEGKERRDDQRTDDR